MTPDSIELEYWYSAKDRLHAKGLISELNSKEMKSGTTSSALGYLMPVVVIFLGYEVFLWLKRLLPKVYAGNWAEILNTSTIFGNFMGLIFIIIIVQYLWLHTSNIWGPLTAARKGRKGVNWGKCKLDATPETLTIQLTWKSATYRWDVFTRLVKTKNMLILMLTPGSAVFIPRRTFESTADEDKFCAFLESHIGSA